MSPRGLVDIAAHSDDGSNGGKLVEDLRHANISSMNDVVGAAQHFDGFRAKQTVRIGDDADQNRAVLSSQFSVLSTRY